MASLQNIVQNILHKKIDFCCLCFRFIGEGEESIGIDDEVVFRSRGDVDEFEMSLVLITVLGLETFETISSFEVVCQECARQSISSYIFRQKCKENSRNLSKTIESLMESFNNISEAISLSNNLFVTLNTGDYVSQQLYDNKRPVATKLAAFKRFKLITKAKEIKDSDSMKTERRDDLPRNVKYKVKHKIRNRNKTEFKTADMAVESGNISVIRCKECPKEFQSSHELRKHFIRLHAPKKFKCSKCERSYGSAGLLKLHENESHCTVVCSECGKTFHNRHTFKMHELGHKFRIVCQACGRVYKNRDTYKKHLELDICSQKTRKSPSQATYQCDLCDKKYSQKHSLNVHIKFEHGNGKAHVCMWCNKRFNVQSRLKAHIVKHTRERNFQCDFCNGKFVSKESLLYHTRIHTGEKPYQCEECDQRFISASRRAEHIKRHHTGLSLECNVCHQRFMSQASLLKHCAKHTTPEVTHEMTTLSLHNQCDKQGNDHNNK